MNIINVHYTTHLVAHILDLVWSSYEHIFSRTNAYETYDDGVMCEHKPPLMSRACCVYQWPYSVAQHCINCSRHLLNFGFDNKFAPNSNQIRPTGRKFHGTLKNSRNCGFYTCFFWSWVKVGKWRLHVLLLHLEMIDSDRLYSRLWSCNEQKDSTKALRYIHSLAPLKKKPKLTLPSIHWSSSLHVNEDAQERKKKIALLAIEHDRNNLSYSSQQVA